MPQDPRVASQYRTDANLAARQRIYRFADPPPVRPWPQWILDQVHSLGLSDNARVLELGCGNGDLWAKQIDRVPAGWRLVLTDLSPGMIDTARGALRRAMPGAAAGRFGFARADARAVPFADGAFDAVLANHMLYHVPDRRRAVAEIRRVLRPGGVLLAGTNGAAHLAPMKALIERFVPGVFDMMRAGGETFWLEDGLPQLEAGGFAAQAIEVRQIDGALRVTAPQAVIDYVMSVEGAKEAVQGPRYDELRAAVESEIRERGAFVVPTTAGVFIARR